MTITARAQQIGVQRQTLINWRKLGVDIFDDDQVREHLKKTHNGKNLKPEWVPRTEVPDSPDDIDPTSIDIESIIRQLASVGDKHEATTRKIQIDGLLNAYKLREAAGKYVSRSMVEEALIRIGSAVKAAVMRMEADLPPMLEGMEPASMQKIIREKVDEVMQTLSDESSKVWQNEPVN